jgi:putative YphP/YqiW family bacilliredoxin
MPYDPVLVQPMRDELVAIGVEELTTAADVDRFMTHAAAGTSLLIVNSVCGCAAGSARPAVRLALGQGSRPTRVATVFAGQDLEATARARSYFADYPPSSPSFALFKDGKMVQMYPRHRIEGRDPVSISVDLRSIFDSYCRAGL